MLRPSILRPLLLMLCCAALLWARLGGTHLHLHPCERACGVAASVHLSGPGHAEIHQEPSAHHVHPEHPGEHEHAGSEAHPYESTHADIDVSLFDHLLIKTVPQSEPPAIVLALLAVLALGLLFQGKARLPRAARGPPVHASPPPLLRPFLRGPPAHAS